MDRVQDYHRRAQDAERQAEAASDPEAKRAYWQLADNYKELAALIERPRR